MVYGDRTTTEAFYRAPEGRLGPAKVTKLDTVSLLDSQTRQMMPWKAHGYLGMDAMRRLVVRIDFDRGKIAVLRYIPANAGARVDLEQPGLRDCPVIRGKAGGVERRFVRDTGCLTYGAGRITKQDFDHMIAAGRLSGVGTLRAIADTGFQEDRVGVIHPPLSIAGHTHEGLVFSEITNQDWSDNVLKRCAPIHKTHAPILCALILPLRDNAPTKSWPTTIAPCNLIRATRGADSAREKRS